MRSLLGLTAALATCLSTSLGLGVLALPMEEVSRILQGVPMFTIVGADGVPLTAVGDDGEKVTGVFISKRDADEFLRKLRQQKPATATGVSVQTVSLGEVLKTAQANDKKPDPLAFAYVPLNSEVENARKIPGNEYKGGVPLFVARGGQDRGYLTIEMENEKVIPFFFELSQLNEMLARFKREQPAMANTIVIDVVAMENVISSLKDNNDPTLRQIRIVPTKEAIQFIRSLSADSQLSSSLNQPLPLEIGSCSNNLIEIISYRIESNPNSGSMLSFANGAYQVGYEYVPAIHRSRLGDPVRICLIYIPDCSEANPGDERGRIYRTTNLRTNETWELPDSAHSCGGA